MDDLSGKVILLSGNTTNAKLELSAKPALGLAMYSCEVRVHRILT